MRALKRKKEPAEVIDKAIKTIMYELEKALSTKKRPSQICELSRALADEIDHVFTHPELWPQERVKATSSLLEQAATATTGTEYEENCAARPKEFMLRLESLLEAKEAVQRIHEARLAEL